jgi:tight adherence protein C
MNLIATLMNDAVQDNYILLMEFLVFLAAGALAFSMLVFARTRSAVKRRAGGIRDDGEPASSTRSLRYSSLKAVTQLLEYTTKHYGTANDENMKVLRRRLIQAGIYDPRAVAYFLCRPQRVHRQAHLGP